MRLLLVGDPHVTVEELGDAQGLLDGIRALADQLKPDAVIFLGDLHHNHALVRVEVTDFWLRNLPKIHCKKYLLLGNHDRPNDASSSAHALQSYSHLATVIDSAALLRWSGGDDSDVILAPYYHDKNVMVKELDLFRGRYRTLICHQTFDGSVYENGFYAPDGIDPIVLGIPKVVSGHIHTAQEINWPGGTVTYIGSPRWRTASDANEKKNVALYDSETDQMTLYPTEGWCSPIAKATITSVADLDSVPFRDNPNVRLSLDIIGPKLQVEELFKESKMRFPKSKIRPVVTDVSNKANRVSESEGVFNALRRYVQNHKPPYGTNPKALQEMVARRLNVAS